MGRISVVELEGRSYICKFCGTHFALPNQLVSKSFHCRRGKAYLFNNVVNITVGVRAANDALLLTYFVAVVGELLAGNIGSRRDKSKVQKKGSLSSKGTSSYISNCH